MGLLATRTPAELGIRAEGFDAPELRLPVSRRRVLAECLGVLVMAAVVLVIALRQEHVGFARLAVPGIVVLIFFLQLATLRGPPAMVLTRTGFEARHMFGRMAADWRDCGPFEVRQVIRQGRMVTFHPARRSGAFWSMRTVPNRSELSVDDLCRVMNLYRAHARAAVR